MLFLLAKLKSLELKTALAIAIIRTRPAEFTLEEYIQIMRAKFYQVYETHHDEIESLKLKLFEAKKEIFNLRLRSSSSSGDGLLVTPPLSSNTFDDSSFTTATATTSQIGQLSSGDRKLNENKIVQALEVLNSNVSFISNLVKLKGVETMLREGVASEDEIAEWLKIFLTQIERFFFDADLANQPCSAENTSTTISFPYESLLHAMQVFLNAYQIEWLYHLRSRIIDQIVKFVDRLVHFCVDYESGENKV